MVKLKQKELKKEGKQVGDVYHVCSPQSMLYNLKHNSLTPHTFSVSLDQGDGISLTRNKNFLVNTTLFSPAVFRITLDGDRISDNYKVRPYDFYSEIDMTTRVLAKKTKLFDEMEEVVLGKINNLDKYIKNIELVFKANPATEIPKEKQALLDSLEIIKNKNIPFSCSSTVHLAFKRDLDSLIDVYSVLVGYDQNQIASNIKSLLKKSFKHVSTELSSEKLESGEKISNVEIYAFPDGIEDLTEDKLTPVKKYSTSILDSVEYLASLLKAKVIITDSKDSRKQSAKLSTVLNNKTYSMFSFSMLLGLDLCFNEFPSARLAVLNSTYDTKEFYIHFSAFSE